MRVKSKYLKLALLVCLVLIIGKLLQNKDLFSNIQKGARFKEQDSLWMGKSPDMLPTDTGNASNLIRYGYELVAHTSTYLGPNGQVKQITNGMNCQNCHLQAGTKAWGLNYGSVAANYPKFRARSGTVESIYKRVNDCLQRSLNGQGLDSSSLEMQAFIGYISWVGAEVEKGKTAKGSGIISLPYLKRPADPKFGKVLYAINCSKCHGKNGEGLKGQPHSGDFFINPPLWGKHSYNQAAGMFQLSKLAGFIKANMPNGINSQQPYLKDQEAWDLAAFINTQSRPTKDVSKDWPNKASKPYDYPYGPYLDSFTQRQHQLGPFGPIKAFWEKKQSVK
jgi:thiosulfate dehydrogenase